MWSAQLDNDDEEWRSLFSHTVFADQQRLTFISSDTWCRLEDLARAMDYRDGWREKEFRESAASARLTDKDDNDILK